MDGRLLAVGVDGARGGWIAAAAFGTRRAASDALAVTRTELRFFPSTGSTGSALERLNDWRLGEAGGEHAPVAVDVPIGLRELGGSRPCDFQCRAELPGKGPSVFPPPALFLVERFDSGAVTKEQLRDAIQDRRRDEQAAGRDPVAVAGISTQSCAVFDKVWEADRFVRRDQRVDASWPVEEWLFEVHPELCFQRMHDANREAVRNTAGRMLPAGDDSQLASKKTARGQLQRLALIRENFGDAEPQIRKLPWSETGNLDDALDAYAALWTALRVATHGFDGVEVLGWAEDENGASTVPRDAGGTGLLMRMVA